MLLTNSDHAVPKKLPEPTAVGADHFVSEPKSLGKTEINKKIIVGPP